MTDERRRAQDAERARRYRQRKRDERDASRVTERDDCGPESLAPQGAAVGFAARRAATLLPLSNDTPEFEHYVPNAAERLRVKVGPLAEARAILEDEAAPPARLRIVREPRQPRLELDDGTDPFEPLTYDEAYGPGGPRQGHA